ncbi:MAG: DUF4405 domain-containing protein [Planctomycetaceae bacterium]
MTESTEDRRQPANHTTFAVSESSPRDPTAAVEHDAKSRHTPRKTVINYWVDLGLLLIFLALTYVTGVTQFVFPVGPEAYSAKLWGGDVQWWRDAQFGLTAALGLGIILHLMLHWNWLCAVTNTHIRSRAPGKDDGTRTLLGVGLLVAVLHVLAIGLLFAGWALER